MKQKILLFDANFNVIEENYCFMEEIFGSSKKNVFKSKKIFVRIEEKCLCMKGKQPYIYKRFFS